MEPREYHGFYRTPRFRWWHSAVALGAFIIVWGAAVLATTIAVVLYEMLAGGATPEEMAQGLLTPGLFLANNLGIALAIPVALAVHRLVFGQRAGWLCSIRDGSAGGCCAGSSSWPLWCTWSPSRPGWQPMAPLQPASPAGDALSSRRGVADDPIAGCR